MTMISKSIEYFNDAMRSTFEWWMNWRSVIIRVFVLALVNALTNLMLPIIIIMIIIINFMVFNAYEDRIIISHRHRRATVSILWMQACNFSFQYEWAL